MRKGSEYLLQRSYQYDAGGNLTGIGDSQRGATHYRYDPVGQLLSSVQPHINETFAFDPAGNLLDNVTHSAAHDAPAFGGLERRDNIDYVDRSDHLTELIVVCLDLRVSQTGQRVPLTPPYRKEAALGMGM